MTYTVFIKNNSTGEVRGSEQQGQWDEGAEFWWTEGNMGCDCNRKLMFSRAAGIEPSASATPCGDSAFSIDRVEVGGKEVWRPRGS